jgi:hypothetical protein
MAIEAVLGGQRFVSGALEFREGTDVELPTDISKSEEDRLESLDDA